MFGLRDLYLRVETVQPSGQTVRLLVRSAAVQVHRVLLIVCCPLSRAGGGGCGSCGKILVKYEDMARDDDCFYYDTRLRMGHYHIQFEILSQMRAGCECRLFGQTTEFTATFWSALLGRLTLRTVTGRCGMGWDGMEWHH